MRMYPIFICLESLHVLVVGAGAVGKRKITALCEANAGDIMVLDPGLTPDQSLELGKKPNVRVYCRVVEQHDIVGKSLVFAATNNLAENTRIAELCSSLKVLCNVVDSSCGGTFHAASCTRMGDLAAAFSTGGKSPALARRIRIEAGNWLQSNYGPLLEFMGRLRPLVLALNAPSGENSALFRAVAYSDLGDALAKGERQNALDIATTVLPLSLHAHIEELLHGIG